MVQNNNARSVSQNPQFSNLPTAIRVFVALLVSLTACFLAEQVAFSKAQHFPALWAASGVAFAFAWRYGWLWSLSPALGASAWAYCSFYLFPAIGATTSNISTAQAAASAALPSLLIGTFLCTAVGPCVSIFALRKLNAWKPAEYRLQAVLRFVLVISLIAAPIDAFIGAMSFSQNGLLASSVATLNPMP
jgi:hypothetical protein